jgi:tetratricopeptide (TPR) repeat protein
MKWCGPKGLLCLAIGLIMICSCNGGRRATVTEEITPIRQDLASGRFQRAMDTCHAEYQKAPKGPIVLEQYMEAVEHIRVSADKAFGREDFALAGETYALLLKNYPRFGSFANRLSFDRNYLALKIRVSRTRMGERQAQSYLKTGSLQKAINVYQELFQYYPRDPAIQNNGTAFLESIKTHADLAFEKNDLVLAGSTYRVLQRNSGTNLFLACSLSFSRDQLEGRITACQRKLFENGLEQYRSGNLNQAIVIWKSILTFDPENPEVKKAAETASLQLRNLEREKAREGR